MLIEDKENFIINAKSFCIKFLQIAIFLVIVCGIFYLAILTSVFLLAIFIPIIIVSSLIKKFKKKKKYYKMN